MRGRAAPQHARSAVDAALERARRLWLATDFDGTLAPIVPHPSRARCVPGARRALARLAQAPRARVAIISGRALADLERRSGAPGVHLAGLMGIEWRDRHGRERRLRMPPPPAGLLAALEELAARCPGAWIERKHPVVAVHYRAVTPRRQARFAAAVRRRARPYLDRVAIQPGKKVLEMRPRGAPDKADAFRGWAGAAARTGTRDALVFLGDDDNDERVHALVRRLGGVAIAVGRDRSRAREFVRDPGQVAELLEWIEDRWRARSSARGNRRATASPRRRNPARRRGPSPRSSARPARGA